MASSNDQSPTNPFDQPTFRIDPDLWMSQFDDAHRRLKLLCIKLDLKEPQLGEPMDLIYVRILERLVDAASRPASGVYS